MSAGADDDANVWDSYLSYLVDCVCDSGVAVRGAWPLDDSDPDDVDSYARLDDVVKPLYAHATFASTRAVLGDRGTPVWAMAYDSRKWSRGEAR